MKKAVLIVLLIMLTGCGSSLKNSWDNFTAYYNTFYNAKNDFNAGLKKVNDQPVRINSDAPIRPHPAPANAGSENFEEAINNGALILRRHSESKWADDALLLIGKSYYYQQQFFLAIQTFEDLLDFSSSASLKQKAILWKGRALLDIASYREGVSFLEERLSNVEDRWNSREKAEARIILAQHYAMLEEWQQASDLLEPAILNISDRDLKGRSYFLLGQVLQRQNDYNRAYQAFSNVASYFPDYEYIYWAGIKKAEMARLNGELDLAKSIYRFMLSDDKNFERSDELTFQLAQTLEQEGEYKRAETLYKEILRNAAPANSSDLLANIYLQLGQLYSDEYKNYTLAAAYFDSSSARASTQIQDTQTLNTPDLASAFGDYVSLKNEIAAIDSLLRLGELSPQALDSALVYVRQQKQAALDRETGGANTLSNVNQNSALNRTEAGASSFGFLNYRNARRIDSGIQQFRSVWGNRPLVDNWRRTNAIRSISSEERTDAPESQGKITIPEGNTVNEDLGIAIDDIPRDREARLNKKQERAGLQYRLGNLFFLTLDQPDSARVYFNKVLEDSAASGIQPRVLYSLYKLHELQQQPDSAAFYRQRILDEYAGSVYADRINNEQAGGSIDVSKPDSTEILRQKVQQIVAANDTVRSVRAEALRSLALENRELPIAADIFYQGIREYIQFAKQANTRGDSLASYSGQRWDRVRELMAEFKQRFPEASQNQTVNAWLEVIESPEQVRVLSCAELGIEPEVKPSLSAFLDSVELPEKVKNFNLSGSLKYRLLINKDGSIESYELLSNPTNLGIEDAYEEAINRSLAFEPVMQNGKAVQLSCEVEFPIKQ